MEAQQQRQQPEADEQPSNQGERYEQGERSQQQQYELGDPGATAGEDPFHLLAHEDEHGEGRDQGQHAKQ
jgi:hypothetical protein